MSAVYSLCDGTQDCLVSPSEILSLLPSNKKYTTERIEQTLLALKNDGYFDLISSERKGEKMYVIYLKHTAIDYKRQLKQRKRDVAFRIFLAFVGALATFIFGLILKLIGAAA